LEASLTKEAVNEIVQQAIERYLSSPHDQGPEREEAAALQELTDVVQQLAESNAACVTAVFDVLHDKAEHDDDEGELLSVQSIADVIRVLLQRLLGSERSIRTISRSILSTVDLVQRHEQSIGSVNDVVEAVLFNAQNIVTLAEAVGMDRNAFTLKLNYPEGGSDDTSQGTDSSSGSEHLRRESF
jgi:DNA-binding FrmR family transcriptional regulator